MLDGSEIDKLRLLLTLGGWNDVMKPRLENRLRQKIKSLMLFPSERGKEDQDDAALRGAIAELEWMLVSWSNEITVFEHNRAVDELHEQENGREPVSTANP